LSPAAPADAWLCLLAAAKNGGRRWIEAIRVAGDADRLLGCSAAQLKRFGLRDAEVHGLCALPQKTPAGWRRWLDEPGHGLVVFGSDSYPDRLAETPEPPLALWVAGEQTELLTEPQLAIVGSRNPTRNGTRTAEGFAAELGRLGIAITSGLALGIDAASHRGALDAGGSTIAVLGNGIDRIYPEANTTLADRIRANGLTVSEYGPDHALNAWQFPRRNRIIAGLSLGTLVIEATRRSGSLITARCAADFGREVFAVPGSIHSTLSKGCHGLIRDGAKLVESTDDILLELAPQLRADMDRRGARSDCADACALPTALASCLEFTPIGFDELVSASGLTAGELSSMLLHLELQGKIEALPGGRYCRLAKRA
jgi:DNA processing protein